MTYSVFFLQVVYKMTTTRRDVGYDGLHREPQMEEIVNYLANHQERMRFPDRQARQIRNHPFMTQLDFFDTNEEQKRAWEVQKRKEEVKEIATQSGTSEAMEKTKGKGGIKVKTNAMTKTRGDTGIVPPDIGGRGANGLVLPNGVTRGEATEQYDDDVRQMRLNPATFEEHKAESKTLRHERGNKSDSMAQSVRFSLRERTTRPDAPEAPVFPGIHIPRLPVRVPMATNIPVAVGEHVPVPIGIRERVGMNIPILVKEDEPIAYDIFAQEEVAGSLKVAQREEEMKKDGMLTFALKRMREAITEAIRKPTPEEKAESDAYDAEEKRMAWYLRKRADERDGHIQSFIDGQAEDKK
jgi:hypothetical protein